MLKTTLRSFFRATLLAGCNLTMTVAALGAEPSADEKAVRETLNSYVEAFNKHDAAAVSEFWAEKAVHIDRNSDKRLEGRAAIKADFEELFEDSPGVKLAGEVGAVDFVTPDVAVVEGHATLTIPGDEDTASDFSATLVRQKDSWKLQVVQESSAAVPDSPHEALRDLVWLVGSWVDNAEGDVKVSVNVEWSEGGEFLIRSFHAQTAEGVKRAGTQIIGWDPRAEQIRSWTFNADGSFGDGVWSKVGDAWHVASSQTLVDGRAAGGTYVLTPVDENSMTIQLIGHEIEGEPQPSTPAVTVVRAEAPANPATESKGAAK